MEYLIYKSRAGSPGWEFNLMEEFGMKQH